MKKKILLKSCLLTQSGYAQHAKLIYDALSTRPDLFDLYIIPTNWGNCSWQSEISSWRDGVDALIEKTVRYHHEMQGKPIYDISIQVDIPSAFELMAPINIGVSAMVETSKISHQWVERINAMDLVLVPSQHAKQIAENSVYQGHDVNTKEPMTLKVTTPIEVVPYHVDDAIVGYVDGIRTPTRLELDIPDNSFLCVAQWGPRKSLPETITWFVEEFFDQDVGLVVKTSVGGGSLVDREETERRLRMLLSKYQDRKCKVLLLHGNLTNEEMIILHSDPRIKANINIAHGEGYGLPIFESAQLGVPNITINWSGQTDFLYAPEKSKKTKNTKMKAMFAQVEYDLSEVQPEAVWGDIIIKDSKWAFADQGSYKMRLRDVLKNHPKYVKKAKKLQKHILESDQFNKDKIFEKIVELVSPDANVSEEDINTWLANFDTKEFN
jgi:hypothetical protein